MSASAKASSIIAARYVGALIDLAQQDGKTDAVAADIESLARALDESADLRALIKSASIGRSAQRAALQAIAATMRLDVLTINFIAVLVQNRRIAILSGIITAFRAEMARRRGEMTVDVTTAQPLSGPQIIAVQQALGKNLGRVVTVRPLVDPSILGGMIAIAGSKMIDDSVRRKLEKLKASMTQIVDAAA